MFEKKLVIFREVMGGAAGEIENKAKLSLN